MFYTNGKFHKYKMSELKWISVVRAIVTTTEKSKIFFNNKQKFRES